MGIQSTTLKVSFGESHEKSTESRQRIELGFLHRAKAADDVLQILTVGELCEGQAQELVPNERLIFF